MFFPVYFFKLFLRTKRWRAVPHNKTDTTNNILTSKWPAKWPQRIPQRKWISKWGSWIWLTRQALPVITYLTCIKQWARSEGACSAAMGPFVAFTLGVVLQWAAPSSAAGLQDACRRGGGVDSMLLSQDQREARELQYDISCSENDTARALFLENVIHHYGHGNFSTLRMLQLARLAWSVWSMSASS